MRMWRLLLVIAVLSTLPACAPPPPDRSLERIRGSGELVVGIDPSYPPFATVDDAGTLAGYDADLAREVARRLGAEARFVALDVGGIHDALIAQRFDAIISSLPPFPELSKQLTFSRPYFNAGQVLVVRHGPDLAEQVNDFDAIAKRGGVVAIEAGSTADLEMRTLAGKYPNMGVRRFSAVDAALEEVRRARVDAAIVDTVSAHEFIARAGGLRAVGDPITVEPYVVSTRKADAALAAEIDRIIAELDGEGFLERLRGRWLERGEQ